MLSNVPKERGIPFVEVMVRAIQDGRKSQTRRIMKPQPVPTEGAVGEVWSWDYTVHWRVPYEPILLYRYCPYGPVGDRLIPLTTWAVPVEFDNVKPKDLPDGVDVWSHWSTLIKPSRYGKLRPGRFMPLKLRHHLPRLEITGVKVERLQDISDADCFAEGVIANRGNGETWYDGKAKEIFSRAWDAMHGPDSWKANPWLWCISFKRIDDARAAA